jgi:mRNA-degrading endonuclease toxin of MazEF toxin-antitoxin module
MPDFQWGVFETDLDPVTGAEQKGKRPVLVVVMKNSTGYA